MINKAIFIICYLSVLISTNLFASENINEGLSPLLRKERKESIRKLSALIIIDENNEKYASVLKNINPYPQIDFNVDTDKFLVEYDNFVKDLIPYILVKLKNKEINGELPILFEAISLAKKMSSRIKLSNLEEATFEFLKQSLNTENTLRACNLMMSRYSDTQKEIDFHLNMMGPKQNNHLIKGLKKN